METLKQLLRWLVHLLGLGPDMERLEWFAGLAQKIEPRASFEVLALPESEKLILKEISTQHVACAKLNQYQSEPWLSFLRLKSIRFLKLDAISGILSALIQSDT